VRRDSAAVVRAAAYDFATIVRRDARAHCGRRHVGGSDPSLRARIRFGDRGRVCANTYYLSRRLIYRREQHAVVRGLLYAPYPDRRHRPSEPPRREGFQNAYRQFQKQWAMQKHGPAEV